MTIFLFDHTGALLKELAMKQQATVGARVSTLDTSISDRVDGSVATTAID